MKIVLFIRSKFFQTFFTLKKKRNFKKKSNSFNQLKPVMTDYSFLHDMLNEHDNFVFVEIYFYIYDTRIFQIKYFYAFYLRFYFKWMCTNMTKKMSTK